MKIEMSIVAIICVCMNISSVIAMNNNNNHYFHDLGKGPLVSMSKNNDYDINVLRSFYDSVGLDDVAGINAILKREIMDKNSARMLEILKKGVEEGHLLFAYRYNRYLHGVLSSPTRIFERQHFNDALKTVVLSYVRCKQDIDCCGSFANQEITTLAETGSKALTKKYLQLWQDCIKNSIAKNKTPDYKNMITQLENLLREMDYECLFPEDICSIGFASMFSWTLNFETPSPQMRQRFNTVRNKFQAIREATLARELAVLRALGSWDNFLKMYTELAA